MGTRLTWRRCFRIDDRKIGEIWYLADLPVLVKFVFTSEKLSVQVHPDDEFARAARAFARQDGDVAHRASGSGRPNCTGISRAGHAGSGCARRRSRARSSECSSGST